MKKTFLLPIVVALMCACGGNSPSPNPSADSSESGTDSGAAYKMNIHAFPGECPADQPADLAAYFDSLYTQCNAYVNSHEGSSDSAKIWQDVAELDRYAKGQRKYFPDKEVWHALNACAFELGYAFSHGPIEGDTADDYCEVFFFRFLEQAARLTPEIDYVTSFHSADGDAGILYYSEWSLVLPLYSFLIYPKDKGYGVQMVGERGEVAINKVFTLKDGEGNTYYLCSNNTDMYFAQYVYLREGDSVRLVASTRSMLCSEGDHHYDAIVFNPQRLCWEYCTGEDGNYRRVEGSPAMKLILDGHKTQFVVN